MADFLLIYKLYTTTKAVKEAGYNAGFEGSSVFYSKGGVKIPIFLAFSEG